MVVSSLIWLSNTELTAYLIRYVWIRPYLNSINPKFFPMKCKIVPKRYNIKPSPVTDIVVIAAKSKINFFAITYFYISQAFRIIDYFNQLIEGNTLPSAGNQNSSGFLMTLFCIVLFDFLENRIDESESQPRKRVLKAEFSFNNAS